MAFKEYFSSMERSKQQSSHAVADSHEHKEEPQNNELLGKYIALPLSDARMPKSSIVWNTTRMNHTQESEEDRNEEKSTGLNKIPSLNFGRRKKSVVNEERFKSFEGIVQAILLFIRKYILDDSEFCINIPYSLRTHYTRLYRDPESTLCTMSFEDRITVFDACFVELFKLLRDSFSRFVKREEYDKCVQLLRDVQ